MVIIARLLFKIDFWEKKKWNWEDYMDTVIVMHRNSGGTIKIGE